MLVWHKQASEKFGLRVDVIISACLDAGSGAGLKTKNLMSTASAEEPQLDDLVSLFRDYKGDETGGQHAIRGFSFQIWQAVLEVLRAHATEQDYAVVLEWQQDIAILNSSTNPTEVEFVQVKKNESSLHWSLRALMTPEEAAKSEAVVGGAEDSAISSEPGDAPKAKPSRRKAAKPSVLAKLYAHRLRFKSAAKSSLVFSSNVGYVLDLDGDGDIKSVDDANIDELPEALQAKIVERLRAQLKVPDCDALDLTAFVLRRCDVSLDNAHKPIVGELVELCQFKKIVPPVTAPFIAVHLIASYMKERAGKAAYAKDLATLLRRGVTRSDVDSYFAAANDSDITTEDLVKEVATRLDSEVANFSMVRSMRRQMNKACIEITNRASPVWDTVRALRSLYRASEQEYEEILALKDRFTRWTREFRTLSLASSNLYDDGYLYCLMAMIIQDANPIKHLSAVPPGAQPEATQ